MAKAACPAKLPGTSPMARHNWASHRQYHIVYIYKYNNIYIYIHMHWCYISNVICKLSYINKLLYKCVMMEASLAGGDHHPF